MGKLVNKLNIFSPEDERDYKLSDLYELVDFELPEQHISKYNIPITNQFWSSMCVSHALSTCMSYCEAEKGIVPNIYSKGFIYANRNGKNTNLEGMVTRDAIKILHKEGDCQRAEFRWSMSDVDTVSAAFNKKEKQLEALASPYKIIGYYRLNNVEDIKRWVYLFGACVLCYPMRKSNGTYINKAEDETTGSHAIVVIGWTKTHLILQNSWGKHSGDHGLFYMAYDYDWREAWGLYVDTNAERKPTSNTDGINQFFFSVKEFFIGLGYWIKKFFSKNK